MASADLRDEEAIRKGIARAEFVKKGELDTAHATFIYPLPLCKLVENCADQDLHSATCAEIEAL